MNAVTCLSGFYFDKHPDRSILHAQMIHRFSNLRIAPSSLASWAIQWILALSLSPFLFAQSHSKPNIILILADDIGYGDLGCYGQEKIRTPHIDALAGSGTRFTQAYAGGCVCTPSRSVLMTGLHNGHTPARDNVPHFVTYLKDDDITLVEVLSNAGYRNGGVGKWSLGAPGSEGSATNQGFDMWFGYMDQDHAHYYYPEYLDDSESKTGRFELLGNSVSKKHYSHDLLAERALQFIRQSSEQPFFLYAAFTLAHFSSPSEDPDRLAVPSMEPYENEPWSDAAKKYAAMFTRLDKDVGRMVNLVNELGLRENTLILFTSDNGPWEGLTGELDSSGPLRGGKRTLYEGGIRVPFIASWPGKIPQGATSSEIIAFWDIFPTLAEISGTPPPENLDGISVLPALLGQKQKLRHPYLYWDYGHNRAIYHQAVRLGRWKGIRQGRGQPIELYDLDSDPGESVDLTASHKPIIRQIDAIMSSATTPSDRYPIGELYRGKPIWKASEHW